VDVDGIFDMPPQRVVRHEVRVMLARTRDELPAIQDLWPRFERLVGLRGRKMFALVDEPAGEYATCTPILENDDPDRLGLEIGVLAGGAYLRVRLLGEPPQLYNRIAPAMSALATTADADTSRPSVEYYRRYNQIELWLPVA
jgi:hypothetical protein